jgi:hypothetical protein
MSGTFCFELKKNAMIPLPVTTYDIEKATVIQIRQPSSIRTVLVADFDNDMQTDIFMNNILRKNYPQSNSVFDVNILTDANITIVEHDCG